MAKHVSKEKFRVEFDDSLIIIICVVLCVIIKEYLASCVILLLHQIYMFLSYYLTKDTPRLPDSGFYLYKKIYNYYRYACLGTAVIFCLIVPLKTHDWINGVKTGIIFALLSCQYRLFDSFDFAILKGRETLESLNVWVSSNEFVTKLGHTCSLIMNKTGTVTEDKFKILSICPKTISKEQFMAVLCKIEYNSHHPIAYAIGADRYTFDDVSVNEISGSGVIGTFSDNQVIAGNAKFLNSYGIKCDIPNIYGIAVHLAVNDIYYGYVVFENKTKNSMFDTIVQIRESGIKNIYMLSSDLQSVVQPVSQALGFDVFKAELSSDDKKNAVSYIVSNKQNGTEVGYLGNADEIDSACFADVSISMVQDERFDVCLPDGDISVIPSVFKYTRHVAEMQKINLYVSLATRIVIMIIMLFGFDSIIVSAIILMLGAIFTFLGVYERIRL